MTNPCVICTSMYVSYVINVCTHKHTQNVSYLKKRNMLTMEEIIVLDKWTNIFNAVHRST